jgi:hypothetical protein
MSEDTLITEFDYKGLTLKMVKPSFNYRFKSDDLVKRYNEYVKDNTVNETKLVLTLHTKADNKFKDDEYVKSIKETKGTTEYLKLYSEYITNKLDEYPDLKTEYVLAYNNYTETVEFFKNKFFKIPKNAKELFELFFLDDENKVKFLNMIFTGNGYSDTEISEDDEFEYNILLSDVKESFFLNRKSSGKKSEESETLSRSSM